MKRKIVTTADGSNSIYLPDWDEHYHSKHGAIQEAEHVFINKGLDFVRQKFSRKKLSILEMGFGTGLNALVSLLEAEKHKVFVDYVGVEAYPVPETELAEINYGKLLQHENAEIYFQRIHQIAWEEKKDISPNFSLWKQQRFFADIKEKAAYDLIFFDAFGPRVQPELWTEEIFSSMFGALKPGGILTTYSAKGSVRRAMMATGFKVERLPGPPGKREMLRAQK